MFTSFSTALSALDAMSTAIDVVGNNLANLNTPGFKDSTTYFRDLVPESLGVAVGGADHQFVAVGSDAGQFADPADVDQGRGEGEPQLHHRQQRVAAGQQLGVVAELGQQFQGVLGGVGGRVLERRRDHGVIPAAVASAAASTARTMLW